MSSPESTRWSVVRSAARGSDADRDRFALRYEPAIRAYLGTRWKSSSLAQEIDDAVQEVFVDCFKPTGVLARAQEGWPGGFRAYFYGVVRNVARTLERRRARQRVNPARESLGADRIEADEEGLSTVFDRAWTVAMLREVADHQAALAAEKDEGAVRRVELLRLRFHEGLPIREIARLWEKDAAWVHHEYAKARREFQVALRDVVATQHPGSPEEVDEQCQRLLDFLT